MTSKKLTIITLTALWLCTAFFMIGFTASATAQQSAFAESPCDPGYYASLKSRAWMEAQREITQNQNLITKPDSVLEYTCFDQYASVLAANAHKMFSENRRWDKVEGVNLGDMGRTLQETVGGSLQTYAATNFSGPFMDGRVGDTYEPAVISAVDNRGPRQGSFAQYNCNKMNSVWRQAKCTNFASGSNDGFFTLADYATGDDKRSHLGQSCAPINKTWQENYVRASGSTWTADVANSYQEQISNTECGSSIRIPTGIVSLGKPEFVCLTPGCISRDGGACSK